MAGFADLFFMGAAFMLLETKSVVQFALLFGTTWFVNALVFAGVLLAVLAAVGWGLVAGLARVTGDVGVAEDVAQEALVVALEQWPSHGVPPNPAGWLMTTVGARGEDWGRVILVCDAAPGPGDLVLVERTATTLALARLLARQHQSLERQAHATLISAILAQAHADPDEAAARARALGIPVAGRLLLTAALGVGLLAALALLGVWYAQQRRIAHQRGQEDHCPQALKRLRSTTAPRSSGTGGPLRARGRGVLGEVRIRTGGRCLRARAVRRGASGRTRARLRRPQCERQS